MWLITAEEGHKDDLLINRMVVVATVEEIWQFAKEHLEGKSAQAFLEPALVRADFVPATDEYRKKRPSTSIETIDVAFEQNGVWVLIKEC